MDNIKIRKILLMVILVLVLTSIGIGAVHQMGTDKFHQWVNDYEYDKHGFEHKWSSSVTNIITGIVLGAIFGLLAWVFAMVYTFSTKNNTKRDKKWPYILMLVFSSLLLGVFIIVTVIGKKNGGFLMSDDDKEIWADKPGAGDIVQAQLDKYYNDNFKYVKYIEYGKAFIDAAIIACASTIIVLIKKNKEQEDIQFSKQVLEDGSVKKQVPQEPANDLP